MVGVGLQVMDSGGLLLRQSMLPLQLPNAVLELQDISTPVLVLGLPFLQGGLLNFNLLVQQIQLLVPPDQLGAQDVPLPDHSVELLLLVSLLLLGFLDVRLQLADLGFLGLHDLRHCLHLLLCCLQLLLCLLVLLLNLVVAQVFLDQGCVLFLDLFLQLLDFVVHFLELQLHVTDGILGLQQVFRIHIPLVANVLVEGFLLSHLYLVLRDLLLEARHLLVQLLHLLTRIGKPCVGV
mmetsp:Transcript_15883/g.35019  ORF Transcript_15883/g.35019 Transcript_15883/m.35019 type:complete len:236 (-) Transcript_15883:635-1342(-)